MARLASWPSKPARQPMATLADTVCPHWQMSRFVPVDGSQARIPVPVDGLHRNARAISIPFALSRRCLLCAFALLCRMWHIVLACSAVKCLYFNTRLSHLIVAVRHPDKNCIRLRCQSRSRGKARLESASSVRAHSSYYKLPYENVELELWNLLCEHLNHRHP